MSNNTLIFNFRIIVNNDGTEVVDRTRVTPWEALTPSQQMDYLEWEKHLLYIDRMRKKEARQVEHKQGLAQNLFYRVANACGIL